MKIALLQMNPSVGDFRYNTEKILKEYHAALGNGAELVVAPELALSGYPPQDLLLHKSFYNAHQEALSEISKKVGDIGLVLGVVEENSGHGKRFFNSAVLIQNGKIMVKQRKTLLPTYGEFDERRYFEPNQDGVHVFIYNKTKMAMLVCEDIWVNESGGEGRNFYHENPVEQLKDKNIDLLISINASPYYWGKGNARLKTLSCVARLINGTVVYVNRVGGQDELVFDGGSFVLDRTGKCTAMAGRFVEESVYINTNDNSFVDYNHDDGIENLYNALVLGFRDYTKRSGLSGAVIGLSGGIDSAVAACIAAKALGKENVVGLAMPAQWSSEGSVKDAEALAKNLGVQLSKLPVNDIYNVVGKTLKPEIGWNIPGSVKGDVTEENIQARIRGLLIMAVANRDNLIAVATGNKSEIAVGYATLYGDMVGGFAVLKDVFKMDVYRLADFINKDFVIIPKNTIEKPPSAELAPGQEDTDSLPSYEILDTILKYYIEENEGIEAITKRGHDETVVSRVISMVNRSEYKRRQGAPGVLVSKKGLSVGAGRVWPISNNFLPQ